MKKDYTKLMNHDDVEAVLDKAKGLAGLIDSMYFAYDAGSNKFDKEALMSLFVLASSVVADIEEMQPKVHAMYEVTREAMKGGE